MSPGSAGLEIRNVSEADSGEYVCRATTVTTGQMEERTIRLQVTVMYLELQTNHRKFS